jgi:hypothetical protein
MSQSTYFVQECPTCGRRAQIRVEHLGREVVCNHCQGRFEASDPNCSALSAPSPILSRANELLATVDQLRHAPR